MVRGVCVYGVGRSGATKDLLIWPEGYQLHFAGSQVAILDGSGTQVAVIGQPIRAGGGEYEASRYEQLRPLLNGEVPLSCREDPYWLITDVEH